MKTARQTGTATVLDAVDGTVTERQVPHYVCLPGKSVNSVLKELGATVPRRGEPYDKARVVARVGDGAGLEWWAMAENKDGERGQNGT